MNPITSWDELLTQYQQLYKQTDLWIFRGQRIREKASIPSSLWDLLEPTLERATRRLCLGEDRAKTEARLLREFKRHVHRYTSDIPDEDDNLRWLALMRHHQTPTRFLDFTYSFFIAVFFALEHVEGPGKKTHGQPKMGDGAIVWAIDRKWLEDRAEERIPDYLFHHLEDWSRSKLPSVMNTILTQRREVILSLNPMKLDERLALQQGLLLTSLDLTQTFSQVLQRLVALPGGSEHIQIIPIKLSVAELKKALAELRRMNITRRTLFPDIDGLAQDLENWLVLETPRE